MLHSIWDAYRSFVGHYFYFGAAAGFLVALGVAAFADPMDEDLISWGFACLCVAALWFAAAPLAIAVAFFVALCALVRGSALLVKHTRDLLANRPAPGLSTEK